jgi:tight adherence protein C
MSGSFLLAGGLASLGLAIALVAVAVLPARSGPHGVAVALAAIEKRYGQRAPVASQEGSDPFAALPAWVKGVAVRLSPSGVTGTLQRRLDLAGNPARWNPDSVLAVKGLGLLVFGAFGVLFGLGSVGLMILYGGLAAAAGFFLPDILLYNVAIKRQARIQALLPDAMDMLTVCVEAGLGFDAALGQVARNTSGPLADELARALQEMQIGASRTQALRAMVDRTTVPELRGFVSALVQATELGIAVAQVLREQAKEMRLRRRQRAEEKAQKVPIKILFPLIFCLFPGLFVAIIGPGVITIAHTFLGK